MHAGQRSTTETRCSQRSLLRRLLCLALVAGILVTLPSTAHANRDDAPYKPGKVFDHVVKVLHKRLYDERLREEVVPELAARYRKEADSAATLNDERAVIQQLLSHLPLSHLGLLSEHAHKQMMRNLACEKAPTFGFELAQIEGDYFVQSVLEGGAGDQAGVKRGDRIVAIDGVVPALSPRLDWRSDDAALTDPPSHALLVEEGERIALEIERTRGMPLITIEVTARNDSAYEATKRSAEVVEVDEHNIAIIHFWYIHTRGNDTLLTRLFNNEFKDAQALVLDLRGRGGNAQMVGRILRTLVGRRSKWNRPVVALIDGNTRSAKELLAWELRQRKIGVLVGQTTAGALLPAAFEKVGGDSVLMYPAFPLGKYTDEIEGKGVQADVQVAPAGLYSAGADPIREAGLKKAAELAIEHASKAAPVN
jgi:carboxyl-terminal processing protease